jgi:hypothetical protein
MGERDARGNWEDWFASSRATRHACAVPYINEFAAELFRDRLLQDSIRQLPTTFGTDLRPVLLHTAKARKRRTSRDARLLVISIGAAPLVCWTVIQGRPLGAMVLVMAILALSLPMVFRDLSETRSILKDLAAPGEPIKPSAPRNDKVRDRLSAIHKAQSEENISIHDGFEPFNEYGHRVSGWSLLIPLRQGESAVSGQMSPFRTFTAWDLSEWLKKQLPRFSAHIPDSGASSSERDFSRIPHRVEEIFIEDRVFVNGHSAMSLEWLWEFPDRDSKRPKRSIMEDEMRSIAETPDAAARHYLCTHVSSWDGELVTSTFLHISTDQHTLYIDCQRAIMPPMEDKYRILDRIEHKHASKARLWGTALLLTPLRVIMAPALLTGRYVSDLAHRTDRKRLERDAATGSGVDFSVGVNIRKWISKSIYRNHFQKIDADKHLKVIERHILANVIEFLGEHGVDVSEFKTQQTAILNEGIIQIGGISNVENQSVGTGATAFRFSSPKSK